MGFIAAVPEPTTTAMLGLAGLLAFAARRRRALQS
ncbi:MAG: MprA protease, GlyGly-CTERM protein-sorting domain-containing form [Terrimicrobiaceae bacterium]